MTDFVLVGTVRVENQKDDGSWHRSEETEVGLARSPMSGRVSWAVRPDPNGVITSLYVEAACDALCGRPLCSGLPHILQDAAAVYERAQYEDVAVREMQGLGQALWEHMEIAPLLLELGRVFDVSGWQGVRRVTLHLRDGLGVKPHQKSWLFEPQTVVRYTVRAE